MPNLEILIGMVAENIDGKAGEVIYSVEEKVLSKRDVAKDVAEQAGTSKQTESYPMLTEEETSDDETYIRPESEDDEETTVTSNSENSSREVECKTAGRGIEKAKSDEKKIAEEKKTTESEKTHNPKKMEKPLRRLKTNKLNRRRR